MPQQRLHHLDWLRALCFALLTPYHAAIAVQAWPFFSAYSVENAAFRWFMDLVAPWRPPALFFIRRRRDRLLYPLLFGMLVVVPPMVYVERRCAMCAKERAGVSPVVVWRGAVV